MPCAKRSMRSSDMAHIKIKEYAMKKYFVCMQIIFENRETAMTTYITEQPEKITTGEKIILLQEQIFSNYMQQHPDAKVISHMIISLSKL